MGAMVDSAEQVVFIQAAPLLATAMHLLAGALTSSQDSRLNAAPPVALSS